MSTTTNPANARITVGQDGGLVLQLAKAQGAVRFCMIMQNKQDPEDYWDHAFRSFRTENDQPEETRDDLAELMNADGFAPKPGATYVCTVKPMASEKTFVDPTSSFEFTMPAAPAAETPATVTTAETAETTSEATATLTTETPAATESAPAPEPKPIRLKSLEDLDPTKIDVEVSIPEIKLVGLQLQVKVPVDVTTLAVGIIRKDDLGHEVAPFREITVEPGSVWTSHVRDLFPDGNVSLALAQGESLDVYIQVLSKSAEGQESQPAATGLLITEGVLHSLKQKAEQPIDVTSTAATTEVEPERKPRPETIRPPSVQFQRVGGGCVVSIKTTVPADRTVLVTGYVIGGDMQGEVFRKEFDLTADVADPRVRFWIDEHLTPESLKLMKGDGSDSFQIEASIVVGDQYSRTTTATLDIPQGLAERIRRFVNRRAGGLIDVRQMPTSDEDERPAVEPREERGGDSDPVAALRAMHEELTRQIEELRRDRKADKRMVDNQIADLKKRQDSVETELKKLGEDVTDGFKAVKEDADAKHGELKKLLTPATTPPSQPAPQPPTPVAPPAPAPVPPQPVAQHEPVQVQTRDNSNVLVIAAMGIIALVIIAGLLFGLLFANSAPQVQVVPVDPNRVAEPAQLEAPKPTAAQPQQEMLGMKAEPLSEEILEQRLAKRLEKVRAAESSKPTPQPVNVTQTQNVHVTVRIERDSSPASYETPRAQSPCRDEQIRWRPADARDLVPELPDEAYSQMQQPRYYSQPAYYEPVYRGGSSWSEPAFFGSAPGPGIDHYEASRVYKPTNYWENPSVRRRR